MTYLLNNGDLCLQCREHLRGEYEQSAVLLSALETRLTWLGRKGKEEGREGKIKRSEMR
jgi:hypothetical protein